MAITYDPKKEQRNLAKHQISLARFADMDQAAMVSAVDDRHEYGETRWIAVGPIESRLHVAIVTYRAADVHVISLRRANRREQERYRHAQK